MSDLAAAEMTPASSYLVLWLIATKLHMQIPACCRRLSTTENSYCVRNIGDTHKMHEISHSYRISCFNLDCKGESPVSSLRAQFCVTRTGPHHCTLLQMWHVAGMAGEVRQEEAEMQVHTHQGCLAATWGKSGSCVASQCASTVIILVPLQCWMGEA